MAWRFPIILGAEDVKKKLEPIGAAPQSPD